MPPIIRIATPELARFVDLPHAHGTVDDLTDEDYRPEAQPPFRCAAMSRHLKMGPSVRRQARRCGLPKAAFTALLGQGQSAATGAPAKPGSGCTSCQQIV